MPPPTEEGFFGRMASSTRSCHILACVVAGLVSAGDGDGLGAAWVRGIVCVWLNARVTNMLATQKRRAAKISMVHLAKEELLRFTFGIVVEARA